MQRRSKRSDPFKVIGTSVALVAPALLVAAGPSSASGHRAEASPAPATVRFAQPDDLLSGTATSQRTTKQSLGAHHALRARLAHVNGSLFSSASAIHQPVRFNLFDDASYTGVVQGTITGTDYRAWSGVLSNAKGYFYAARSGNALAVHVATVSHGIFEVSQVDGSSTYRVIHLAPSGPEDAPAVPSAEQSAIDRPAPVQPALSEARAGSSTRNAADDSGNVIDVMATYSNQALAAEGSRSAMRARIALAVTETNGSYRNSGVKPRLRLVRIQGFNYDESGSFDTDLARVAGTSDGFMDGVHAVRSAYGADLVALVIANRDYCGLADDILARPATAFTTVSDSCATGYYSFGHEFGHLQGARHDTFVDRTNKPYGYGHGYVNLAQHTRTIMSYNDKCVDHGFNCTRLQYWSNPHKKFKHKATGTASTKNYVVLNKSAHRVANFMPSRIASNFTSSMNHSKGAKGWTALVGHWTKGAKYFSTKGVEGTRSSAKHGGTFGDVTFIARMRRTKGTRANGLDFGNATITAKSWTTQYLFQYANNGTFSVFLTRAGRPDVALRDWTTTKAVHKFGWNTLRATVASGSLTFWINGKRVWHGADTTITRGSVGVSSFRKAGDAGSFDIDSASSSTTAAAKDAAR